MGKDDLDVGPPFPFQRFGTERHQRLIRRATQGKPFENVDQANAFLNAHFNGRTSEDAKAELNLAYDPAEEAQELMFQAMETDSYEEMMRLTQEALALDPENVDARLLHALSEPAPVEEKVLRIREIVRRAEEVFGEEFMRKTEGHFYGDVMTRPYMRAQQALFDLLMESDDFEGAIAQGERMLQLNPNDNQGARDMLLALYLHTGKCADARALMKRYKDTAGAVQSWFLPLERYLSNNRKGAKEALKKAFRTNPHVLPYLVGYKEIPDHPPSYYSLGEESEAACLAHLIGFGWWKQEAAMEWLISEIVNEDIKPDLPQPKTKRLRRL